MTTAQSASVQHQPEYQRFIIQLPEGEARLTYRIHGRDIDFNNTYVPTDLRGQGLAERLVRAGLRWAKAEQLSISASCWYVARFLRTAANNDPSPHNTPS